MIVMMLAILWHMQLLVSTETMHQGIRKHAGTFNRWILVFDV
jgi:hypothetical protein